MSDQMTTSITAFSLSLAGGRWVLSPAAAPIVRRDVRSDVRPERVPGGTLDAAGRQTTARAERMCPAASPGEGASMPSELTVHAVQQGPMEFAISDGEHEVTIDYPLPGSDSGPQGHDAAAAAAGEPGRLQRKLDRRPAAPRRTAGRARRGDGSRAAPRRTPDRHDVDRPRVRGVRRGRPGARRARPQDSRRRRSARCGRCSRRVRPSPAATPWSTASERRGGAS